MLRRPPGLPRTHTPFPYTTLFLSPRNPEHHRTRFGLALRAGARVDADDHLRPREAVRRQIIDAVRVGGVAFGDPRGVPRLRRVEADKLHLACGAHRSARRGAWGTVGTLVSLRSVRAVERRREIGRAHV